MRAKPGTSAANVGVREQGIILLTIARKLKVSVLSFLNRQFSDIAAISSRVCLTLPSGSPPLSIYRFVRHFKPPLSFSSIALCLSVS